jgi:single-strand DNA-binding protein
MIICGRLGADPELHQKEGSTPVAQMSVATPGRMKDGEQGVEWIKVVVFGKTATNVNKFLKKGSEVLVEGRYQQESYEKDGIKRYSTKCVAYNVVFMGASAGTKENKKEEKFSFGDGEEGYDSGAPF